MDFGSIACGSVSVTEMTGRRSSSSLPGSGVWPATASGAGWAGAAAAGWAGAGAGAWAAARGVVSPVTSQPAAISAAAAGPHASLQELERIALSPA